jgi:hypothetical protein
MFSDRAIALHGPAGAGKHALAEQLAAVMGWPLVRVRWRSGPARTLTGPDGVARTFRACDQTLARLAAALAEPVVIALSEPPELAEDAAQVHLALAGALATPAPCDVELGGRRVWVSAGCVVCFCFRARPQDPRLRCAPGMLTLLECRAVALAGDEQATMRRAETVALVLSSRLRHARGLPAQFPDFTASEVRGAARAAQNFTLAARRGLLVAGVGEDAACRLAQDVIVQSALGSDEPVRDALRRFSYLLADGTGDPVGALERLAGDALADLQRLAAITAEVGLANFDAFGESE